MRTGLIVTAILLGACSNATAPGSSHQPTSSPAVGLEVACRLPIAWTPTDALPDSTNSGTAFVTFPEATLSAASSPPTAMPFTRGPSYAAAAQRWLPVAASAVSPDGSMYAFADYDPPVAGLGSNAIRDANAPVIGTSGRVHVVDARTGADRVLFAGRPTYTVVAFGADGLYLAAFGASMAGTSSSGLFRLDTSGGSPRAVPGADIPLDRGGWQVIDGGGAWGTRFTQGPGAMWSGNQLVRFDLASHTVSTWMTVPIEDFVTVLGFERGHPLVFTEQASYSVGDAVTAKVVLLTGPNQATQVMATVNPNDAMPSTATPADADSHGLWIGGPGTIWLYRDGRLRHASVVNADRLIVVGGTCA